MATDLRQELIQYLQPLIDKRVAEGKPVRTVHLNGCVGQYTPFKDWLLNNYDIKQGSDLKQKLLSFIYDNTEYFTYDPQTGSVANNQYFDDKNELKVDTNGESRPGLIKPKILIDLEISHSLDTFDNNLTLFELIVFIYLEVSAKAVTITDLIESIECKFGQHLQYYKTRIGFEDQLKNTEADQLDLNFNNENVVLFLVNQLSPFFHFDLFQRTLTINTMEVQMSQLSDCLSKTGFALIRNALSTLLYRFGKKSWIEAEDYFTKEYATAYHYLMDQNQCDVLTDQIINLFGDQFVVEMDDTLELPFIDLKPELVGEERWRQFQLMYKYGHKIVNLSGSVEEVGNHSAVIGSKVNLPVIDGDFMPAFIVKPDFIQICGQNVEDMNAFLHCGDRLTFDVMFATNVKDFDPKTNKLKELWIVSRIDDIKHSAFCFIKPIVYLFHTCEEEWEEDNEENANSGDQLSQSD